MFEMPSEGQKRNLITFYTRQTRERHKGTKKDKGKAITYEDMKEIIPCHISTDLSTMFYQLIHVYQPAKIPNLKGFSTLVFHKLKQIKMIIFGIIVYI
jgi:hypothetical protein